MGDLPVQRVAVFGYLEPLSAVVLSALVLGEAMGPVRILGAALIIGGAASCELLGKRTFHIGRRLRAAQPAASGAAARA